MENHAPGEINFLLCSIYRLIFAKTVPTISAISVSYTHLLVLTNHHCGYGAIQQHSSVEHDYLTDGFWAMSREEELPCKGLTVDVYKRQGMMSWLGRISQILPVAAIR